MLSVEKIGGTSMTRFNEVLANIILPSEKRKNPYKRIFVLSAYGGVTDLLLESKKSNTPGVYAEFVAKKNYEKTLDVVGEKLLLINESFKNIHLDISLAESFITQRINQTKNYLQNMAELISSGYVDIHTIMLSAREILASIGEAHAAFNSANILQHMGIQALALDLSGFHDSDYITIDERIEKTLSNIDFSKTLPLVTGYVKGTEGIMRKFDRGYTEVTFSKIAAQFKAQEAVIHKEYHFCSSDPTIVSEKFATPVCNTSYDVLDQLSDIWMEAVHPAVSKTLQTANINLRIKNTFDPLHPGTSISKNYRSQQPRVEIISGTDHVTVIEIHDPAMVGAVGFDSTIMSIFSQFNISYIIKTTNANSISIVIRKTKNKSFVETLKHTFFQVTVMDAAIVCILGTNLSDPHILATAASTLAQNSIEVLCVSQSLRQVNIQFVVHNKEYVAAIKALHTAFFNSEKKTKK